MAKRDDIDSAVIDRLGIKPFQERFPWIGGDLQTLRDTFRVEKFPYVETRNIKIKVPPLPNGNYQAGHLLTLLDLPFDSSSIRGLVLILHGLGGSSQRQGLRRMAFAFLKANFAVLRVNLRGAFPGRDFAGGTYSAKCCSDLKPIFIKARAISLALKNNKSYGKKEIPLIGAGISLGGTILLNACLNKANIIDNYGTALDALVCTSSPLDLLNCSKSIERQRNSFYQAWLLRRLIKQTINDPFGITSHEKSVLSHVISNDLNISTIRDFDSYITAPRWGYNSVEDYYEKASPIGGLYESISSLPRTLFLQAIDDPWVPNEPLVKFSKSSVAANRPDIQFVITKKGGHNGFHGPQGCWGDNLAVSWVKSICEEI